MANALAMSTAQSDQKKNIQATTYTAIVVLLLLLFFILWHWPLQQFNHPPLEEGMEVNLGNSDQGFGDDQAFLPGKPAPTDEQAYTPPPKTPPTPDDQVKDIATDDKDEDAPEINKPKITKPDATKVPDKEVVKETKPVKKTAEETPPAPVKPKPKAVFKGVNGTGTGGNESDSYKKGGNEGVSGGKGDQGRPGGDPDSKNYTGGGTGNSGISVSRGLSGRRMVRTPSFQDDFNENAKVAVDIRVDQNGNVISAEYQQRGSTTADANKKDIAISKAKQIKFSPAAAESSGTIIFTFKVTN